MCGRLTDSELRISKAALEIKNNHSSISRRFFMLPSTIRNKFFSVISDIEANISSFVNNPGSDMTRHRYCDFKDTIFATLSFSMGRTNTELYNYFELKRHIPSKSAFTQQRKKFNSLLYPHLLSTFNEAVPFKKTYKGFHLVAVDGTDINLPTDKNDTVYRVKQVASDYYYYQMHLNALYDICENRYISALTQPRPKMNENAAFCKLVNDCTMPQNTIFIADRGYGAMNTIATLLENNRYFLIRVKSPASAGSIAKNLIKPDVESDKFITLGITRSRRNVYTKNPTKYKSLTPNKVFDYIDIDDKTSVYNMNIRCTCIKLSEDSYEYLISNLPLEQFSSVDLKELYWKRWSIETSFRSLKYALSLVYLHSVNRELIIQEVYAKIIMYNLTSLIHSYVQESKELLERNRKNKYNYQVSFDDTVSIAKSLLKQRIKNRIIKALLLVHLTANRVIEVSARHMRSQTVKPLNNRA